jgi:hypothetical protein
MKPGVVLRRLEAMKRRRVEIDSAMAGAVTAARAAGASWATVGAALGVSAQAVQQRYGSPGVGAAATTGPLTGAKNRPLVVARQQVLRSVTEEARQHGDRQPSPGRPGRTLKEKRR